MPRIINKGHNRMVRSVIYQLERQYGGGPINIYKFNGETVDYKTGVASTDKELIQIDRGIILPARHEESIIQTISKISAAKPFVYGGTYNRSRRTFLIDRRKAPDLELTVEDWLVYDEDKYEIKHFDTFEFESLWVIVGHRVVGDIPNQIFPLCAEDRVPLTESATEVI